MKHDMGLGSVGGCGGPHISPDSHYGREARLHPKLVKQLNTVTAAESL